MLNNNTLGCLVVDRAGKRLPGRISALSWRTIRKRAMDLCRVPCRLANQKRAGNSAPTLPGPDHHEHGAFGMADAFPKTILPLLEGQHGKLREMRFWSKVDMRGPDECWLWQAGVNKNGYGSFKIASYTVVTASRAALIMAKREEPCGMLVLHHCDTPRCCNPAHLYFGTAAQNTADKIARNRARNGALKGEANPRAKMTADHVRIIVERIGRGWNNKQIAADLPVSHSMVSLIRLGKAWGHDAARFGYEPAQLKTGASHG